MKHSELRRVFNGILALTLPLPLAATMASCSGSNGTGAEGDASTGGASVGGQGSGGALNSGGQSAGTGGVHSGGVGGQHAGGSSGAGGANGTGGARNTSDASTDSGNPDAGFNSCGERIVVNPLFGAGCGQSECFPLEPGTFPADAGTVLPGTSPTCQRLCGAGTFVNCQPAVVSEVPMIKCQRPLCEGRRPSGLSPGDVGDVTTLPVYLTEMARLEAASVFAFRRLRRELIAHRAPLRLVRAAGRAARDEVRHARMTSALARRCGGVVRAPVIRSEPARTWEAVLTENAVEGCVRETFGALLGTWQARAAADPYIRAAMERIARDETRHAALAHAVDAWGKTRLDRAARKRVDEARKAAEAELADSTDDLTPSARAALGLPTPVEARFLAKSLNAELGV